MVIALTRWTWVRVNSGSWWWTGRPGVLRFMGSQRVGHDWATELNWTECALISFHRRLIDGHLWIDCVTWKLFHLSDWQRSKRLLTLLKKTEGTRHYDTLLLVVQIEIAFIKGRLSIFTKMIKAHIFWSSSSTSRNLFYRYINIR